MSSSTSRQPHRGLAFVAVVEAVQAAVFLAIAAHVDDLPGPLHRLWVVAELGAGLAAMGVGIAGLVSGFWSHPSRAATNRRTARRRAALVLVVVVGVTAEVVAALGPVADDDVALAASAMEGYLLLELAWQYRSVLTRYVGIGALLVTAVAVAARLEIGLEPGAVTGPGLGALLLAGAGVTFAVSRTAQPAVDPSPVPAPA